MQATSTNPTSGYSGGHMFGWFQRLLPRKGDFFGMFEAHAATLVAAADALHQLANDGVSTAELLQRIRDREHEADDIIRQVLTVDRRDGRCDRRDARRGALDRPL
jgi:hypothetical protein